MFVAIARPVGADILEVEPSEIVMLPSAEDGVTRVAMKFDLSGLGEGEGRRINHAVLQWSLPEGNESVYSFEGFVASSAWTKSGVTTGKDTPEEGDRQGATILGSRNVKEGRMLVRIDLRTCVTGWLKGTESNHGIILATKDLKSTDVASELAKARLKIWYGFVE